MKRYTCLFLLIVLLTQNVPVAAASGAIQIPETTTEATVETQPESVPGETARAQNACGENAFWSLAGGTLTISGSGNTDDFSAGAPWAAYKSDITAVVIQSGITYLGASAFENYDSLVSVSFGDTFRETGPKAFRSCDGLTAVSLPASFRVLGEESFMSCAALKTMNFAGGMPSFRLNCLWDTYTKLIYPVKNPWPLEHIIQLEESFQGRIEFLASDGTDPYITEEDETEPSSEPTVETTAETTEETTEATTEATTQPTVPATTAPAETVTVPTEATTEPVWTTEETQPEKPERMQGGGIGLALVLCVVSVVLLVILVAGKLRSGGKYSR